MFYSNLNTPNTFSYRFASSDKIWIQHILFSKGKKKIISSPKSHKLRKFCSPESHNLRKFCRTTTRLLSLLESVSQLTWQRLYSNVHCVVVCFTDPFSLSYSAQLSQACFQPKAYHILSYYHIFLGRRGSRIGAIHVLNGQSDELRYYFVFRIILISKRGYRSRLAVLLSFVCKHDWLQSD